MARWERVLAEAPDVGGRAQRVLDAHRHKTIATLRRDGSPRISGMEVRFWKGDLWLGMMPGSRKALDLRRDPRLALHSAPVDPDMKEGDAKVAGRAEEIIDAATIGGYLDVLEEGGDVPSDFHLFRVEVTEVVVTRIGDPPDHLLIESWREGRGLRRVERR